MGECGNKKDSKALKGIKTLQTLTEILVSRWS